MTSLTGTSSAASEIKIIILKISRVLIRLSVIQCVLFIHRVRDVGDSSGLKFRMTPAIGAINFNAFCG